MLPLPNMAIYEIENKVDLFICFHFYSAMIGIREKLQLRMPFSAFSLTMRTMETDCV